MSTAASPQAGKVGQSLGLALTVIAAAQLMLVLDDSIANIALPTIQNELGISSANLPWVINAYICSGSIASPSSVIRTAESRTNLPRAKGPAASGVEG